MSWVLSVDLGLQQTTRTTPGLTSTQFVTASIQRWAKKKEKKIINWNIFKYIFIPPPPLFKMMNNAVSAQLHCQQCPERSHGGQPHLTHTHTLSRVCVCVWLFVNLSVPSLGKTRPTETLIICFFFFSKRKKRMNKRMTGKIGGEGHRNKYFFFSP